MKIPLSSITLSQLEKTYAYDALDAGWIGGTGKYVDRFERAFGARINRRHVVAVSNGTTALELALRALEVGPGDEVVVPALTFVAPAASVRAVGAEPVLADVSANSWTISPNEVAKLITRRTKAIIAVDALGHTCDFEPLEHLGIPIIEDAAEAHGAAYRSNPAGSFGIVSIFSFHANKAITTGEGGCVATDDDSLARAMRLLANHGMTSSRPYWHEVVGRNFRMSNLTAAVGLGQVERWDELIEARRAVARRYDALLTGSPIVRRPVAPWADEACWLYTVAVDDRDLVVQALRAAGIDARGIWTPLCDLPLYREGSRGSYPVAKSVGRSALWLPTWSGIPAEDVDYIVDVLRRSLYSTNSSTIAAPSLDRPPDYEHAKA